MLNRKQEYIKMANVESQHWWYKILHKLIIIALEENNIGKKSKILDAGCGTGGVLQVLKSRGYEDIKGFDLSEVAVEICNKKKLDVVQCDLKNIGKFFSPKPYSVIISCDTLYFLNRESIPEFIDSCFNLLEKNGILVVNLPALDIFKGVHDLSVGINKRFSKKDLDSYFQHEGFYISKVMFWPILLMPLIMLARGWQRLNLRVFPKKKIESDIDLPSSSVNNILYKLTCFDIENISYRPMASSLFVVLKKREVMPSGS